MNSATLQPQLQQPYRRETWHALLPKLLPGVELFAQPHDYPLASGRERTIATARRQFGTATLADGKRVAFYEIEVAPGLQLQSNRVGLRSLVVKCIDEVSAHAVLAFFVQPGKSFYRLTYAAKESKLGDDLKIQTEQTATRRFTYILGAGESCRTAAERFGGLPAAARLDDLTAAFSVEKLNKEFFADFRKAFDLVAKDILARNKGWQPAEAERETQTLLSRLLFLYFIQRKGWLNRQRDYLIRSFNRYDEKAPQGTTFYDLFLKNFFAKLSNEEAYYPACDLGDLPFLNGGLFDDDSDALTERARMKIGNVTFRHVFDRLLEAYNFTVREDTPLDVEVAIDPEMLGQIFEALVLQFEQSDTGGKNTRHDTGSHYTPRPIVHYLCREGLRAWLEQFPPDLARAADWPKRLAALLSMDASDGMEDHERAQLKDLLTTEEARTLLDRLDALRACDLAVGSGAFPVGLLHELVNLRRLCECRARGKDPAADIAWVYETKKRIIENVLYGVDIQPRAVEICKLRLWISLMVDYPLDVDPDNCALTDFRKALKRITPLPNLDFKIRRANSLVEQIRGHTIQFPRNAAASRDFALSLSKLATAKHRFYEARRTNEKRLARLDALEATAELAQYEFSAAKLKYGFLPSDKDAAHITELARAEAEMGKLHAQINAARAKARRTRRVVDDDDLERLARVFNDETNPTFVWQLDFAEVFHRSASSAARGDSLLPDERTPPANADLQSGGFDLMVGNPPYVRMELFKAIKSELRARYPHVHSDRADLYCYFYACAVQLLANGGVLSFITSNKFFRAGYGAPLRDFLATATELQAVIDFGDLPIFEATAYPCIVVACNRPPRKDHQLQTLNVRTETELARFSQMPTTPLPQKGFGWRLESPPTLRLLEKMKSGGSQLGRFVSGNIYRGIVSGLNEAFIIGGARRQELIAASPQAAQVIKPYMGGKHVRKWVCENPDLWMIYMPHGVETKGLDAVLDHLRPFRKQLEARATEQAWYELQQPQEKFCAAYTQPKIIFPDIANGLRFALDTGGSFFSNTAYCVATDDLSLLAILNARAVEHFYVHLSAQIRGGYLRFWTQYVEKIPIPSALASDRDALAGLVKRILAAKRNAPDADTAALEREIDERVYRLYNLTPDEIKIAEEASP